MAEVFSGKIRHTEETIQLLYQMEYHTYDRMKMLTRMAIGAIMVVLGLTVEMPMVLRGILMAIGCWLLVSQDFPAASKADRAIQARNGSLPVMEYEFHEKNVVLSGEGSMTIRYDRFQRLVKSEQYLYLFLGKGSVCMIDKDTIDPWLVEDFMDFIEEKTGKQWTMDKPLIAWNIRDVFGAIKDRTGRR